MNRTLMFGIATFFAIVAFALMGPDKSAVAGHGGCNGKSAHARCGGKDRGHHRDRCAGRRHHRDRKCCGCAGSKGGKGGGEVAPPESAPEAPAAPAPPAAPEA